MGVDVDKERQEEKDQKAIVDKKWYDQQRVKEKMVSKKA